MQSLWVGPYLRDVAGFDAPHAALHCRLVQRLAAALPQRLAEAGLADLYAKVEQPLARVLADMEWRGVRIDAVRLARYTGSLAQNINFAVKASHATALMLKSDVQFETEPRGSAVRSVPEIAEEAASYTVQVMCLD